MCSYVCWFDGACEPVNPGGTASWGAIIEDEYNTIPLEEGRLVGEGAGMSNNVAEYAGIIQVFEHLQFCSPGRALVQGDSLLVINQVTGKWTARGGLYYPYYLQARELLARLRSLDWQIELLWIPREENTQCDALCRRALEMAGVPLRIQPSGTPSRFLAWSP